MFLSVVIPVYNERNTIREIVAKVYNLNINKEIILVDDGSTDGTIQELKNIEREFDEVRVIFHSRNQGKGAALRTGFGQVKGDYVIVQDADLEYDPADFHKLLEVVESGEAEVVYGSRFVGKTKRDIYRKGNMHWLHLIGNKFLTKATNLLYGVKLTDMETCYKLIPANLIRQIKIRSDRFNFEPEITAKILKRGYKIKEVPIHYSGREMSEGKNISWRDGPAALWALIKFRFME